MSTARRAFVDTSFVLALFNRADAHHERASRWLACLRGNAELWVTEAVLTEVCNALAASNRRAAVSFAEQAYQTAGMQVVSVDPILFQRALELYRDRPDKAWGLTDCVSFVVMADRSLVEALTADRHFEQAGFVALLLRDPPG